MAIAAAPERRSPENAARPLTAASLLEVLGGSPSVTGKRIAPETAMAVTDVAKCVNVLAQSIASLPAITYQRIERGKTRAAGHPVYRLLHDAPNPWMSAYELKEALQGHLCLWGNAFAEIDRDDNGNVRALYPLRPDRMERPSMSAAGTLLYPYTLPSGQKVVLPQSRVLHLRGLSSDGLWGYSPIGDFLRDSAGLAKTLEEHAGRFFGRNSRPGGVLQVDRKLTPDAAGRLARQWEALQGGLENAHRVAVLEEGVKWQAVGIPPNEAQHLESRKFQRGDIAGIFRVPPHMIGDLERATFSNIEQQSLEFVVYSLGPWLVNWEQRLTTALLREDERERYFVEFLAEHLLRGDSAARGAFYTSLFNLGVLSPNDIREKENLNPIDGGDERFVPLNLTPLSQVGHEQSEASLTLLDQINAATALIRTGFEVQAALKAVGLPAIDHLGLLPVTVKTDQPAEPQQNSAADEGAERRANGSDARQQLARRYREPFRAIAETVVRSEVEEVGKAASRLLASRSEADFTRWLDDYYRRLPGSIADAWRALMLDYAREIQADAAEEVGAKVGLTDEMRQFVLAYVDDGATAYAGRSRGQLESIVREAGKADALPLVLARLAEWREKRPDKVADLETTRLSGAVTRQAWQDHGVKRLRWVATGKSCPYCARLNGKTVGIADDFVKAGESVPGGEHGPFTSKRRIGHPPLHLPCDCQLKPA